MGCLDSLSITGSALTAERFRTDVIMQNLANQNTTRTVEGGPYVREQVVLRENALNFKNKLGKAMTKAESGDVYVEEVTESQSPLVPVYNPDHPGAGEGGCVMISNMNGAGEMADLIAAARAYKANATVLNIAKSMALKALEISK